ncbi:MAG: hypothetical protein ABI288_07750 [Ginsengibacter sp.]
MYIRLLKESIAITKRSKKYSICFAWSPIASIDLHHLGHSFTNENFLIEGLQLVCTATIYNSNHLPAADNREKKDNK